MLKKHKYYFINVNLIDRKGKLFKVKVVINSGSASNLIHLLLVN